MDGTKVKANASKHKAMSYGRMEESMKKLDEQIGRLLEEAAARDAEEDRRYGKGRRGDELPEEMRDPNKRAERLRQAARELEAEKKLGLAVDKVRRREKIRRAKEELEKEARQKAEAKEKTPRRPGPRTRHSATSPTATRESCRATAASSSPTTRRWRWTRTRN
ncbi:hypothetical protein ACN28S_08350 [Cystobacter fuscus]